MKSFQKSFHDSICFLCFILVIAGCARSYGPKPDGLPRLVPVTITVSQEGQPLVEAAVTLTPADGSRNWFTGGTTDSNGRVAVHTYGTHRGSPTGKFKVTVSKYIYENMEEYQAALDRGEEAEAAAKRIRVKMFSFVEDRYGDVTTTPLEIEVTTKTKTLSVDAGPVGKVEQKFVP